MLWFIESLGGLLLFLLLVRKSAWRDAAAVGENVAAGRRRIRLITGGLVSGLSLGVYLNGGFPDVLSAFTDPSSKTWVYFAGIPLVLIVFTLFLSKLRKEFVD
jgi:hypothetical protein